MLPTLHMGFHVSGWTAMAYQSEEDIEESESVQSLIERQRRRFVSKRPFGVTIIIEGGFNGYWSTPETRVGPNQKRIPLVESGVFRGTVRPRKESL
jgi:hypothetical protein